MIDELVYGTVAVVVITFIVIMIEGLSNRNK